MKPIEQQLDELAGEAKQTLREVIGRVDPEMEGIIHTVVRVAVVSFLWQNRNEISERLVEQIKRIDLDRWENFEGTN